MAEERERRVEAEGGSPGEAKWAAMKELERRFPGITADAVTFEVLEVGDGEEGRVRVAATVDVEAWKAQAEAFPGEPSERVRALVARIAAALGLRASVDISETDEELRATVNGEDLGLLIGKHGVTIDAVQHLAFRAAFLGKPETGRKRVVVDAAGYRERREAAVKRAADRAVEEALAYGRPVELDPMGATERKIVHQYLADNPDVETHSEGEEPDRRLVITPLRPR